ncbi:hypothetical protein [Rubrivirga sp.]|uniref:hypothetical protein n=1 Tax=Rubrivirga sp. TaxID=1885344 RepID=UPI003C769ACC
MPNLRRPRGRVSASRATAPLIFALLALFACADTTQPAGIQGTWVNGDPVTTEVEVNGPDGPEVLTTTVLYRQVEITDSTLVDTFVHESSTSGPTAYVFTRPYRLEDGLLALEGDAVRFEVDLEDDTLTVRQVGMPDGAPPTSYVRGSGVSPDLVGSWVSRVTDRAGIVVGIRIIVHPDGTVTESPDGDVAFTVLGPYLLTENRRDRVYAEGEIVTRRARRIEVDGDRLRIPEPDGDDLSMVREPRGPGQ